MKTKEFSTNFDKETSDTEEEVAYLLDELKIVDIEEGRAQRQLKLQQRRREEITSRLKHLKGQKDKPSASPYLSFQDTGLKDSSDTPQSLYIGSPVSIRRYNSGRFRNITSGFVSGTDKRGYIKVEVTTVAGERTHTFRDPNTCRVTGLPQL